MTTQKYNGWTNYPTWCVALWLSNSEDEYCHCIKEAKRLAADAPNAPQVKEGIWTIEEAAIFHMEECLRSHFRDSAPQRQASNKGK